MARVHARLSICRRLLSCRLCLKGDNKSPPRADRRELEEGVMARTHRGLRRSRCLRSKTRSSSPPCA
eukprot:scaffold54628_cov48-Phaeocystis_antarctica.AAC.1